MRALVEIRTGATLTAALLSECGADIVNVGPQHAHVLLALCPDGWGIVDSLTALETRVGDRLGLDGLLLDARVVAEVRA
jgi:hypothetical protein